MTKVKCPNCQFANPPGAENCVRCRTPLPRVSIQPDTPGPAPAPNAQREFQVRRGQIVANRYTVMDIVGRGGMGCIYKVRDNTLGEEVALKMLLPQFAQDRLVVERFLNEARIARQLSHPNIVRVHDIGIAGQALYISMELLKGASLRGTLEAQAPGQRLPLKQVLDIFDQLCSALEYAHQYTVHRDLKPENVMVLGDGTVKLMDFGISKLMSNVQLTSASMVMGTPYYMSPEQLKDSRSVDARADIYSLGVMLYEILTGNLPTGVPKAASQLRNDLPPALDPIVEVCVDPDPAKRYQNIVELRNALLPIKALVDSGSEPSALSPKPHPSGAGSGILRKVVGVTLLLAIIAGSVFGISRAEKKRAANAASGSAQPSVESSAASATPSSQSPFDAISERMEIALPKAKSKAKSLGLPSMTDLMDQTADQWQTAQKAASRGETNQALAGGRRALQCCLGVILQGRNPDMVFIAPGEMDLSDPQTNTSGKVRLDGFLIDKTEVTNAQFYDFARQVNPPWRTPPYFATSTPEMAEMPVLQVTFYDALAYAAWKGKSLPTEAQWAMAAYGSQPDATAYPWGDEPNPDAANVAGGKSSSGQPVSVAAFQKSGEDVTKSGCYGMEGNVSEWTRSEYRPFPYSATDGREDVKEFGFATLLAVRGSNYTIPAQPLNVRYSFAYDTRNQPIGFRCVLEVPTGRNLAEVDAVLHN